MPRELTRQFTAKEIAPSRLDTFGVRVSCSEKTVRVSLSGTLDRQGVAQMISRVAPGLVSRGCRIILDGSALAHLDFRATHSLIRWNRHLRAFDHQLYLKDWNNYLKAILVMEDWDRELEPAGSWRWPDQVPDASLR